VYDARRDQTEEATPFSRPAATAEAATDLELLEAAAAGDASAFETLYRRHRDWVHAQAWRWTGDRELALDAVQETFIYLASKLPGLELRARLTTFLYPVVKHISIRLRDKQRLILLPGDVLDSRPATDDATARADRSDPDGVLLRQRLYAAMERLSDQHREVVLLRIVDDLKLSEIAEVIEVPLGTVKSRLHHALAALRRDEWLRSYFDGNRPGDLSGDFS
jgi:RNA polymerase sigma-70 factor (ECF subfamily)